jgi:hypothetical protein
VTVDYGGEPSSSLAGGHGVAGENADFIMMDDLVQDMANGARGNEDGELVAVMKLEDAELFEEIIDCLDNEDVLFGDEACDN